MTVLSLRKRLILIILVPLTVIAGLAGYWRYTVAQRTAEALYDRSLVAVALAIARDVAVSDGDALSAVTRDLMRNAAEGEVFYHVFGPDGVYVTGYATPPIPPAAMHKEVATPFLFSASYRGEAVRAVRLEEQITLDGLTGTAAVTVWQTLDNRERLATALALRATIVISVLILTVAAVVWFGVNRGLRPLIDLEAAISQRSSNDLRPIKRPLPKELSSLVRTLNSLFGRVERSIASKDDFISNAAHQLRNPVAGVLSLAQAVQVAPDAPDRAARVEDLVSAARHASRLTAQLLSLERARADRPDANNAPFEVVDTIRTAVDRLAPRILRAGYAFSFEPKATALWARGDAVLLAEAVDNLIDNALQHGGPTMTMIGVSVAQNGTQIMVSIRDDGRGIPEADYRKALSRFAQVNTGPGSGLGLPIAASAAQSMGGKITLGDAQPGLCVCMSLPCLSGVGAVSEHPPTRVQI